ncbi:oligosaccharide flippase family protein [Chryseobacterium camelliae]|uniref:Oligosaccharide flippase family protein n=1 Tax=Chryseobacterium camelliae TaxID=1265445 RepID=A0ABY7QPF2_9FLAO|nr:oligosaccharide flippase family protein [Chryseobacterium camelliae]WBV61540.1 oligosaccharide flippase family protein [Chryseobacterium camelliae]
MNFSSKKLTINAVSAVIQVVFTAFLYFFLYKYLLKSIGVEQLGIWSLILSFSSIANLANLGLTSGLVKFVAEYLTEDDKSKIGKLILTSVLTMTILFTLISFCIYLGAHYFLHFIIDAKFLDIAIEILPYSLISLSLNAVSGVFTSVLEGYQKNYLRNLVYIFSGIVMFALVLKLTPSLQLKGIAIAQAIQTVFILLLSIILCLWVSKDNRIRHWKWSNTSFKELFNYGFKFQLVSVAQLLYEPTTKMLLSKFGGLGLVGHYEMATKAVNQFRALLTNANQVVVPVVAEKAKVGEASFLQSFYVKMNRILLLITLPLSTILMIATPFISLIWIGNFNVDFIFSMYVLIVMTLINVMCGPAYFSSMGEGKLNVLVIVHVGMAIINLLLGLVLGKLIGGYGIVLAWGIALSGGSIAVILNYNKSLKINFIEVFQKKEAELVLVSLLIIVFNVLSYQFISSESNILKIILGLLSLLLYLPIITKSEYIKQLISSIKK